MNKKKRKILDDNYKTYVSAVLRELFDVDLQPVSEDFGVVEIQHAICSKSACRVVRRDVLARLYAIPIQQHQSVRLAPAVRRRHVSSYVYTSSQSILIKHLIKLNFSPGPD